MDRYNYANNILILIGVGAIDTNIAIMQSTTSGALRHKLEFFQWRILVYVQSILIFEYVMIQGINERF